MARPVRLQMGKRTKTETMSKDDFVTEDGFEEVEDSNAEELQEQEIPEGEAAETGRFQKLLGDDSRHFKLSGMFKEWYLDYASYTILYRAVPHIVDGLKPVQRRVLHAMYKIDDGAYTKVANIIGQAMQYHPHGDASILIPSGTLFFFAARRRMALITRLSLTTLLGLLNNTIPIMLVILG